MPCPGARPCTARRAVEVVRGRTRTRAAGQVAGVSTFVSWRTASDVHACFTITSDANAIAIQVPSGTRAIGRAGCRPATTGPAKPANVRSHSWRLLLLRTYGCIIRGRPASARGRRFRRREVRLAIGTTGGLAGYALLPSSKSQGSACTYQPVWTVVSCETSSSERHSATCTCIPLFSGRGDFFFFEGMGEGTLLARSALTDFSSRSRSLALAASQPRITNLKIFEGSKRKTSPQEVITKDHIFII